MLLKNGDIGKNLIFLALPTMAEELLSTLLQYVDTAMVGHLGEKATAAVSVTTTVTWLIGSMAYAVGVAVLSMISRALGEDDKEKIKKISSQAFHLSWIIGIVLGVLAIGASPFIPVWMGAENEIRKTATLYFAIICAPMVFRTMSAVLGAAIRGTKDTLSPMVISLCENVLNIILNYTLIYVAGLGVVGAAIGTAISYSLSGIAIYFVYRKKEILRWEKAEFDSEQIKKILVFASPVVATSIVSCMGYVVFAGIVSRLGTTIFAAHSIAVNAETVFYITGYGLRTATQTLVGIAMGENNREKFRLTTKISILLVVLMMSLSGLVLFIVARPLMGLLSSSEQVISLGAKMLMLVSFSEPFFGLMVVCQGIFYGMGHNKYAFVVELISMWGVRILFTFLCVNLWNKGLTYVWICMIADNVTKALMLMIPLLIPKMRNRLFETGKI